MFFLLLRRGIFKCNACEMPQVFIPKEYFLVTKEHYGQQHGRQPGERPLVTWQGIFCQQECPWVHSYSGTKITIKG